MENRLYDLQLVSRTLGLDSQSLQSLLTSGVGGLIADWDQAENAVTDLAAAAAVALTAGNLPPPVGSAKNHPSLTLPFMPSQIFAAASNYVEHAQEMGTVLANKAQSKPYMFIKALSSVIGPGENVVIPSQVSKPDWEVELGVVIGRAGRRIPPESSMDHVAGYTIVNDVSARDQTRREDYPFKFDWFQGKSFDTFAPIGPWFVPRACIADPQALALGLDVNGVAMQNGSAAEMIWNIKEQISYLSSLLTLQPGNLIATGTPTGVGMGRGIFLKPGDTMRAWVENIGELSSPVIAE
jgi:2-keto-4-pentenoate hydratase/2-oxohepta-3-ene-1,7-dioic acid hydratase in catechol pathway